MRRLPRPLLVLAFRGEVTAEEMSEERRFGELIKGLDGRPFRVLCDFSETGTMSPEVADMFRRAQAFAVNRGMERDAFVVNSATLRFQLSRIARDNDRARELGQLQVFEDVDAALSYLESA